MAEVSKEIEEDVSKKRKSLEPLESEPKLKKPKEEKTEDIIKLNIGGRRLATTRSTLEGCDYFRNLLKYDDQGSLKATRDDTGAIFIDRNGDTFALVLDYLRDGALPVIDSTDDLTRLNRDAQFYGLAELATLVEDRLQELEKEQQKEIHVNVTIPAAAAKKDTPKVHETDDAPPPQPERERTPLSASAFTNDNF